MTDKRTDEVSWPTKLWEWFRPAPKHYFLWGFMAAWVVFATIMVVTAIAHDYGRHCVCD